MTREQEIFKQASSEIYQEYNIVMNKQSFNTTYKKFNKLCIKAKNRHNNKYDDNIEKEGLILAKLLIIDELLVDNNIKKQLFGADNE